MLAEYPTVEEAAGSLSASRATLAEAWALIKANAEAGRYLSSVEQSRWNALVHYQIGRELDLFAFIASSDSDAQFALPDGRMVSYDDALDYARTHQVLGDYAGVPDDTSALGVAPMLIVAGILIFTAIAGATFAYVTWADLAKLEEQAGMAREYAASIQACIAGGNSAEACGRAISPRPFQPPPPPPPDGLPGWAKGVIAVGATAVLAGIAWVVIPRYKRGEALAPAWQPAMAGSRRLRGSTDEHDTAIVRATDHARTLFSEAAENAERGDCRSALQDYEDGAKAWGAVKTHARWSPRGMTATSAVAVVRAQAHRALVGRCLRG